MIRYKTNWKRMLIAGALIAQFAKHVWMVYKIKMRRILTVEDPTAVLVYQKTHAGMESKMAMKKMSTVEGSSVPLVAEVDRRIYFHTSTLTIY